MKTAKQILADIPTAASCNDKDDAVFAIWKINKLASEAGLNVDESPALLKRLTALEKKL